jgi:hypothetical protein
MADFLVRFRGLFWLAAVVRLHIAGMLRQIVVRKCTMNWRNRFILGRTIQLRSASVFSRNPMPGRVQIQERVGE